MGNKSAKSSRKGSESVEQESVSKKPSTESAPSVTKPPSDKLLQSPAVSSGSGKNAHMSESPVDSVSDMNHIISLDDCVDLFLYQPAEVKQFGDLLSWVAGNAGKYASAVELHDAYLESDLKNKLVCSRFQGVEDLFELIFAKHVDAGAKTIKDKEGLMAAIRAKLLEQVQALQKSLERVNKVSPTNGKAQALDFKTIKSQYFPNGEVDTMLKKDFWVWSSLGNAVADRVGVTTGNKEKLPVFPLLKERLNMLSVIHNSDKDEVSLFAKEIFANAHVLLRLQVYIQYELSLPCENDKSLPSAGGKDSGRKPDVALAARRVLAGCFGSDTVALLAADLTASTKDAESALWKSAEKLKSELKKKPLVVPPFKEEKAKNPVKKEKEDKGKPKKDAAPAAAKSAAPAAGSGGSASAADTAALEKQKSLVVQMKKDKANKAVIEEAVKELLRLKEACGEAAPAAGKKGDAPGKQESHPAPFIREVSSAAAGKKSGSGKEEFKPPARSSGGAASAGAGGLDVLPQSDEMGQKIKDYITYSQMRKGAGGAAGSGSSAKYTFDECKNFGQVFLSDKPGAVPTGHTDYSFNSTIHSAPHNPELAKVTWFSRVFGPAEGEVPLGHTAYSNYYGTTFAKIAGGSSSSSTAPAKGGKGDKKGGDKGGKGKPAAPAAAASGGGSHPDIDPEVYTAVMKTDIRVGCVLECGPVEGSDKLLKFKIDMGEGVTKQVLSGIKKFYDPAKLVGKKVISFFNIKPGKMAGEASEAMNLCGSAGEKGTDSEQVELLEIVGNPDEVVAGSRVYLGAPEDELYFGKEGATANVKKIMKEWEQIQPKFEVQGGLAHFNTKGKALKWQVVTTGGKPTALTCATLKKSPIS